MGIIMAIDCIARHDTQGKIQPLYVDWQGRLYKIDKVTDVVRGASLKTAGLGVRYTCHVRGQIRYLHLQDGKWYIETELQPFDGGNDEVCTLYQPNEDAIKDYPKIK